MRNTDVLTDARAVFFLRSLCPVSVLVRSPRALARILLAVRHIAISCWLTVGAHLL